MEISRIDASELCSRKLWQLISDAEQDISEAELHDAIEELARRRHYLEELQEMGKLEPETHG
ncbi:MAG: hypothetical protein AAGA91_00690 [Pseudomonadota bacterium]